MWYERCENPQAFGRMYSSGAGLERVRLMEVVLRPDGRGMRLRLELPRFPDHPPPRWHPEADTVQVAVDFWHVDGLRVEGWSGAAAGVLSLDREGEGLRLDFRSDTVRITARCVVARIDRFSAYACWPPEHAGLAPARPA